MAVVEVLLMFFLLDVVCYFSVHVHALRGRKCQARSRGCCAVGDMEMVERWWTRDGAVGDMLGRYLRRQHTWCISCPGLVNGLGSVVTAAKTSIEYNIVFLCVL